MAEAQASGPRLAPAIPKLGIWADHMLTFGAKWGDLARSYPTVWGGYPYYYDGMWAFYQIADYTGDPAWAASAVNVMEYYKQYVLSVNGAPGYRVFPHGFYEDYIRTGNEESKRAVIVLATESAYAYKGGSSLFTRSRETAYIMQAYMYAEKLGVPNAKLPVALEFALGHMDQWFVSKTATFMQPFMVGLTAHALIEYDQMYGDKRIQPLLVKAADWLWRYAWDRQRQSFYYQSNAPYDAAATRPQGAPDLNMLIAPLYGWLFRQTGQAKYRVRGDAIFAGGVAGAYLDRGKQFTQSYRLSFSYVRWRTLTARMIRATYRVNRGVHVFRASVMLRNRAAGGVVRVDDAVLTLVDPAGRRIQLAKQEPLRFELAPGISQRVAVCDDSLPADVDVSGHRVVVEVKTNLGVEAVS